MDVNSSSAASEADGFLKQRPTKMVSTEKIAPQKVVEKAKDEAAAEDLGQIGDEMRQALWPCYDHEKFMLKLEQWPQVMDLKGGLMQETLLHRASRYGNKKAVYALLEKGATPCVRNIRGITPLHLACQFKHLDIAKMLIEKGAPVRERDDNGDEPIHSAAKSGCHGTIEVLMSKGVYVCSPGKHKNSIIHYAAKFGRLHLVKWLLEKGAPVNHENGLRETPLHLAASHYTRANNGNVDLVECLLNAGADINARTEWGDLPIHYAAAWGTHQVMEFLFDEGTRVDKTPNLCGREYFEDMNISNEEAEIYQYSLLQKCARTTCIYKNGLLLRRIMTARNMLAHNMYFGTRADDNQEMKELNQQQLQMLCLAEELANSRPNEQGETTFQIYLKFCPEALNHLFDLCIVKPVLEQVQGSVFFDFFLFNSESQNSVGKGEMQPFSDLIKYGKERFLVHPLLEVFLKLKWYRTMKYYLAFMLLFAAFFIALCGFSLAHLGNLLESEQGHMHMTKEKDVWWYLLAVCHVYATLVAIAKNCQLIHTLYTTAVTSKGDYNVGVGTTGLLKRLVNTTKDVVKESAIPVLTGILLYAPLDEQVLRYIAAIDIIVTSQLFMGVISRLPGAGMYVHMLGKVLSTVLNFFGTYIWTLLGYAIAFHIILPADGPFGKFSDALIKVLTMLMGEYEYVVNFARNENEGAWIAKILFVLFLFDMSVVLMNLVLGLAVSDIEQLQKNSAVRRMMQETTTVMFIDGILSVFESCPMIARMTSVKICGERARTFQDIFFLNIVDLEPNASNRIGVEKYPKEPNHYPCPHNIITAISGLIKARFLEAVAKTEDKDNVQSLLKELSKEVKDLKTSLANLERPAI